MTIKHFTPTLITRRYNSPITKLSRSKIESFINCPKCFYLDVKMGVRRPGIPAFTLNSAVDALLKKEFDLLRQEGTAHALMAQYHLPAVPFDHPDLDEWRNNFVGVRYHHPDTDFEVFGALDDVWINDKKELHVVDYKSTSTSQEISLEDKYKQSFKRQLEIYQWLLIQNGFKVSPTAYLVYANADKNLPRFDGKLNFILSILTHQGDSSWVDQTLFDIRDCLNSDAIPQPSADCEYCRYRSQSHKYD